MSDGRYLLVVVFGCIVATLFRNHLDRMQTVFLFADALGFGCYAVVGVERAFEAHLPISASIMIGVVTACGGGLLRDVLVRDEPELFQPGQLYVLAALLGASMFALLSVYFQMPPKTAAFVGIGCAFVFRVMAIMFNWKSVPLAPKPPDDREV